ncbi:hypothetical protein RND81_08G039700 [Saponaria officinalis]|uniref:Uncharacterized protein n=1 Tax=Saponaria officinalis TaxID=3572 RepID=A0AAW1J272_SAPOF
MEAEGHVGGLEGQGDPLAATSTFLVRRGRDVKFISSSEASCSSVAGGRRKRLRGHSDDSWTLREAAPGGPIIPSILPSFTGHVAYRLWTDPTNDRGVLTCYQRASTMERLRRDWLPPQAVMEVVDRSGLGHIRDCMFRRLDMSLLSVFIERVFSVEASPGFEYVDLV